MADSVLDAVYGGAFGGPGLQDILGFQKSLQDNSFLRTAASPILGARFDASTWSPGTATAVTAGQAFLGSILNELAARDEAAQIQKVSAVLPSLYADPMSVLTPQGVDERAFSTMRLGAALNKEANKTALAQELIKQRAEAKGEGLKEQEKIGARLRAYGINASSDPESPQYAAEKQKREIEQKYTDTLLTGDEAKKALETNRAVSSIADALNKNDPLGAKTAIFKYAKLLSPGQVTESDFNNLANTGGPLGALASMYNEITQKGLNYATAKSMKSMLPGLVETQFDAYNQLKNAYLESAKEYGAEPTRVKYIKPIDVGALLGPSDPAEAFALAARKKGLSKEEARAQWNALQAGAPRG